VSLAERATGSELMDDPAVAPAQMRSTLANLDRVNRFLGGWGATIALLAPRIRARCGGVVTVLDVGAGSAATAGAVRRATRSSGAEPRFVLLDRHAAACAVATDAVVVRADVLELPFADGAFDFVHASLLLHHLSDDEIPRALGEMRRVAREGVVVNDLHRHALALVAIRWITRLFPWDPLGRHDGPLSVRRGFRRGDLERWRRVPGFERLGYRWRWPFRWLVWCFADGGTPDGAR